jgi:tetratricopeptide (TPR) repeat protein
VEVMSRDLILGVGRFNLDAVLATDSRLNYAYLRQAITQEKLGNRDESMDYYQRYINSNPDGSSLEYARRCLDFICTGKAEV